MAALAYNAKRVAHGSTSDGIVYVRCFGHGSGSANPDTQPNGNADNRCEAQPIIYRHFTQVSSQLQEAAYGGGIYVTQA